VVNTVERIEPTDEQLAADAARERSDGPAFNALLERHRERVWRICFRLLGNEHDAADAAQEVFVSLFLQRAEFAGRSKYSTWVHGIAVRTCLSQRRSRGRRRLRETATSEQSLEQTSNSTNEANVSLSLDLTRMLETLDEEDRALIIMKYAEGYEYEELSDVFGLSVSACKMRISRAREKLKQRFPDHQFGSKTE
jgi:RNA polymerase sigma-70 factor (ECF subfamily)